MDNKTEIFMNSSSSSGNSSSSTAKETKMSSDESSTDAKTHPSVFNFMKHIESYSESDFKVYFKMKRSTIEHLVVKYALSDSFSSTPNHGGKPKIEARKEIYIYLKYLVGTYTFTQLGKLFGIAKSSAWAAVGRVSTWLLSIGREYIKWPQGDVVQQNCAQFESIMKMPGVIGTIGCTHIEIAPPKINKQQFFNREHNCYCIVLQAVVDADMKFIDVCCGEPGSIADRNVLRRSKLYHQSYTNYNQLFPSNTFLLGGNVYTASNWLVPPFDECYQLNDHQKAFNHIHSSTRMVIKDAFDLFRGKFRRITKFTEQRDLKSICKIVVSACILHNLCILSGDNIDEDDEEEEPPEDPEPDLTENRRKSLFNYLCQQNIL